MSDQTNDEMLDQNIARLLSGNSDQPVLSEAAESRMLETLHTKQAKLVSKKEKPMDHAVVPAERKSLIVPVTAVAIVACLIVFAMFFAPGPDEPSNKGPLPGGSALTHVPSQKVFDARDITRSQLEDGTVVVAHRGSKFTINAPRQITLEQGDVYLIVAKSEEPFVVKTKNGNVL